MKIQILGTGCAKCNTLEKNARAAVDGLDMEIEKILQLSDIIEFGVMMTPALAVDGKVISTGKVLSPDEIKKRIGV